MSQEVRARLAGEHGYSGDQAEAFASILVGDDDEALAAHAVKVAELLGSLGGEPKDTPQRAVDPSQGRGGYTPTDTGPAFARRLSDHLRNTNNQGYNPWKLTMGTHRPGT